MKNTAYSCLEQSNEAEDDDCTLLARAFLVLYPSHTIHTKIFGRSALPRWTPRERIRHTVNTHSRHDTHHGYKQCSKESCTEHGLSSLLTRASNTQHSTLRLRQLLLRAYYDVTDDDDDSTHYRRGARVAAVAVVAGWFTTPQIFLLIRRNILFWSESGGDGLESAVANYISHLSNSGFWCPQVWHLSIPGMDSIESNTETLLLLLLLWPSRVSPNPTHDFKHHTSSSSSS